MLTATEQSLPFNDFALFLRQRFPFKVQKISVDAGLTCPNRDGTKSVGGCTYCNNSAFNPNIENRRRSVATQLEEGIRFFAYKYPDMRYIAYFQSYSNTYADIETLKRKYSEALADTRVAGIIIGTRPDCISDELLSYLAELNKRVFVGMEYGVESTLDRSLVQINRQHTFEQSRQAIILTAQQGIPVGAHLILGLPGESYGDMLQHAAGLSALPVTWLKLHQLQIVRHTAMEKQYSKSPLDFHVFSPDEYIDLCIDFLELLKPEIYLDRFVSQTPKELLIAPQWGLKNYEFRHRLHKRMSERNTWQGRLYPLLQYAASQE